MSKSKIHESRSPNERKYKHASFTSTFHNMKHCDKPQSAMGLLATMRSKILNVEFTIDRTVPTPTERNNMAHEVDWIILFIDVMTTMQTRQRLIALMNEHDETLRAYRSMAPPLRKAAKLASRVFGRLFTELPLDTPQQSGEATRPSEVTKLNFFF
jgi:hypothetical protein